MLTRVSMVILALLMLLPCVIQSSIVGAEQPGIGNNGRMNIVLQRRRLFWLAERPRIQKTELGISDASADKIKAFGEEVRAAVRESIGEPPNFAKLSPEERNVALVTIKNADEVVTDKFLPKLKEILTPDQLTRLRQINWQQAYVLDDPEIAKDLSLSKDQKDKLQALVADHDASLDKQFISVDIDTMRGTIIPVGNSADERMRLFAKFQEKINEVLTKEQQEKLSILKGKEFDFQLLDP